ncbi:P-II family nitrogen regulator [Lacticigenium naphthae]|uniref:P-II family nitrogen regulator n=1 Tax=Lacticigenium naphthae TaxID=515351 RepID=UPI0004193E54|nr:P-II family nitrogen regulator [Lacticigenium naphthae]
MGSEKQSSCFELLYIIVNNRMGSKVLQHAKKLGIPGGTVIYGKGTVSDERLNFFSIYEEKKEIVLLGATSVTVTKVMPELQKKFKLDKPNRGIIFSTSIEQVIGSRMKRQKNSEESRRESMYQLIVAIVNKGNAEDVVEAANAVGAKGGTIINARGSGVNETIRLFNMEVEPEKETVLILVKEEIVEQTIESIRQKLNLDKPGNGIIFLQDVKRTVGIVD